MAATVLLLLLLVLITPRLIGVQEDISSLPRLILNYSQDELIIFITSLSGTYIYKAIYLNVTPDGEQNATRRSVQYSHGLEERVDVNDMSQFDLEAVAIDRRDSLFDISADISASRTEEGWSFSLLLSEEGTPRNLTQEDLSSSPFATLMSRREGS